MKNQSLQTMLIFCSITLVFIRCENQEVANKTNRETLLKEFQKKGVYNSPEKYGEHLVIIGGCNDCHTPKKMGPAGPMLDSSRLMSGHIANTPLYDIDRKAMQAKGIISTTDLTVWSGPWGVSYAANLTPDDTGIASWDYNQFKTAIRMGKFHGQVNGRDILPPMPWEMYRHMSDDELGAVFAYLKSLRPVSNLVPAPLPPVQ